MEKTLVIGHARSGSTAVSDALILSNKLTNSEYIREPFNAYHDYNTFLNLYVESSVNIINNILVCKHHISHQKSVIHFLQNFENLCTKYNKNYNKETLSYWNNHNISEYLIEQFDRIVVTIRYNFIDWFCSYALALKQNKWTTFEYEKCELDVNDIKPQYEIWKKEIKELEQLIQCANQLNKKVFVYPFFKIKNQKEVINIDLDITSDSWRLIKQAKLPFSDYVLNYKEIEVEANKLLGISEINSLNNSDNIKELFSIDGWLGDNEVKLLYNTILKSKKDVLELGSLYGKSSCTIASALKKRNDNSVLVCCDLFQNENIIKISNNLKKFKVESIVSLVKGDYNIFQKISTKKWGAIFVDGNHKSPQVDKDIDFAWNNLLKGGYLICHDYNDKTDKYDVKEVIDKKLLIWNKSILNKTGSLIVIQK